MKVNLKKRYNKMVDRIRYPTVSYLPFYYVFFQFLLLTIFNLQANILTTKDILSNLDYNQILLTSYIYHHLTQRDIISVFKRSQTRKGVGQTKLMVFLQEKSRKATYHEKLNKMQQIKLYASNKEPCYVAVLTMLGLTH